MGTSTPGSWPPADGAASLPAPGRGWVATASLVIILAAIVGVSVWATTEPGSYSTPGNGCVTVMVASSTGGVSMHQCGDQARMLCRSAYTHDDKLALLARPQCELAGIAGEQVPAR